MLGEGNGAGISWRTCGDAEDEEVSLLRPLELWGESLRMLGDEFSRRSGLGGIGAGLGVAIGPWLAWLTGSTTGVDVMAGREEGEEAWDVFG